MDTRDIIDNISNSRNEIQIKTWHLFNGVLVGFFALFLSVLNNALINNILIGGALDFAAFMIIGIVAYKMVDLLDNILKMHDNIIVRLVKEENKHEVNENE
jgi:hypothetical protein